MDNVEKIRTIRFTLQALENRLFDTVATGRLTSNVRGELLNRAGDLYAMINALEISK